MCWELEELAECFEGVWWVVGLIGNDFLVLIQLTGNDWMGETQLRIEGTEGNVLVFWVVLYRFGPWKGESNFSLSWIFHVNSDTMHMFSAGFSLWWYCFGSEMCMSWRLGPLVCELCKVSHYFQGCVIKIVENLRTCDGLSGECSERHLHCTSVSILPNDVRNLDLKTAAGLVCHQ